MCYQLVKLTFTTFSSPTPIVYRDVLDFVTPVRLGVSGSCYIAYTLDPLAVQFSRVVVTRNEPFFAETDRHWRGLRCMAEMRLVIVVYVA